MYYGDNITALESIVSNNASIVNDGALLALLADKPIKNGNLGMIFVILSYVYFPAHLVKPAFSSGPVSVHFSQVLFYDICMNTISHSSPPRPTQPHKQLQHMNM